MGATVGQLLLASLLLGIEKTAMPAGKVIKGVRKGVKGARKVAGKGKKGAGKYKMVGPEGVARVKSEVAASVEKAREEAGGTLSAAQEQAVINKAKAQGKSAVAKITAKSKAKVGRIERNESWLGEKLRLGRERRAAAKKAAAGKAAVPAVEDTASKGTPKWVLPAAAAGGGLALAGGAYAMGSRGGNNYQGY